MAGRRLKKDKDEDLFKEFSYDPEAYDPELATQGFPDYSFEAGYNSHDGMLSGAWDKIKGFGKHLAENNPVSLRFDEVRANVDAYDAYWLKRLQHDGAPRKEDYGNEVDFDNDYRKYWDERPLDYEWFN